MAHFLGWSLPSRKSYRRKMEFQVTTSDGITLEYDGEASFTIEHGSVLRIMDVAHNRTILYSPHHWRTVEQHAHVPHPRAGLPPLTLSERLHPNHA
jgi:hypothetical protein